MTPIAIIIPACIQTQELFDRFRANLNTVEHDDIGRVIILCNRLSLMTAGTLHALLSPVFRCPLDVIHDKERSVAGSWNRGIELALDAGVTTFLITSVDVSFTPSTVSALLRFGEQYPEIDIWSSTANNELHDSHEASVDRLDMSCFMLRRRTITSHGWFDKEFKPAYFEDNDYVTRVVLGGGSPKQVVGARHLHQGSLTIKLDPDMAHHVRHWFNNNKDRFAAKWNTLTDDYGLIARVCNPTPYNSGKRLAWWPEQDRPNYSLSGGIHE